MPPERRELISEVTRIPSVRPRPNPEPSLERAVAQLLDAGRAPDLVFQPIVDLQRGETVGYEALSRFPDPPKAGPDRWFATARSLGRALELEALVIERAFAFRAALPDNCFLSINVAPEALLDARVQRLLSAQPLSRLVFELTEHEAVSDYDMLAHVIAKVRSGGGLVAVDDAGAGYASMQHILMLRPDIVKLDRALIAGLHRNEAKAALVEMFGSFTGRLDAWLLAEGIEDDDELNRLVQLGVALGQGYHLGRPDRNMQPLPRELAQRIRATSRTPVQTDVTVAQLRELGHTARHEDSDAQLAADWPAAALGAPLVLLDPHRRASGLALLAGGSVQRVPVMSVLESTPTVDALRRALTRDAERRFEPIVCCTELGEFRGLVRVERLIEAALKAR